MRPPGLCFSAFFMIASPALATPPAVMDQTVLSSKNFLSTPPEFQAAVAAYIEKRTPKIVGGIAASAGQYSWQVSLGASWVPDRFKAHYCGGSIIAEQWILTAAHCVAGLKPDDITVSSGSILLGSKINVTKVQAIIVNDAYRKVEDGDDIALLKLASPLKFDRYTNPVALANTQADERAAKLVEDHAKPLLVVTGWGSDGEVNKVRRLNYAEVPYVEVDDCHYPTLDSTRMLCAGFKLGGVDSCQGDSGSGLTIDSNGSQPTLVGIVSFGDGCALPGKPGVYTRVSHYTKWIATQRQ